jgi:hypothetical protein
MRSRPRRWALAGVGALVAVGLAAALWSLGEERRLGRLVAGLLRAGTGLPISVGAASAEAGRLTLREVRLEATAELPVEARVRRVEVSGGWLPLVAPRSGPLAVRVVAARVTLADGGAVAPPTETVEPLRGALRRLLDWPGTLALRVEQGELHAGGRAWALDLAADKHAAGLTLTLTLAPPGAPPTVDAKVEALGDGPAAVALRGRVVLGGPAAGPVVLEATGRWEPGGLDLAPCTVQWGRDVRLKGRAALSAAGGVVTARADAQGEVAGSRVVGGLTWDGDRGLVMEAALEEVDLTRLAVRLGVATPGGARARQVSAHLQAHGGRGRIEVESNDVVLAAGPVVPLDVSIDAALRGAPDALRLASVETAEIAIRHRGRTLLRGTLASRTPEHLWPLDLRGAVEDPAALAALGPVPASATGTLSVTGEVDGAGPLTARGIVQAALRTVGLGAGGAVRLDDLSATVPWAWGGQAPPGTLRIARITGWGLTLTDVTAAVQQQPERLLISALRYRQAGGEGTGWVEWTPRGRPALRGRLDAERVDLARVMRDSGVRLAQVTGTVRYTVLAQYATDAGLSALARLAGESGGEVSVEAIERLLESAAVQADDTWLLRRTLENLRVFRYEALDGEIRWVGGAGHLDLTLRGRKRLGLFPAPVEAVNLRHVPLNRLLDTLGRATTP